MRYVLKSIAVSVVAAFAFSGSGIAGNNPVDEKWWPSEFGPDDPAGGTN